MNETNMEKINFLNLNDLELSNFRKNFWDFLNINSKNTVLKNQYDEKINSLVGGVSTEFSKKIKEIENKLKEQGFNLNPYRDRDPNLEKTLKGIFGDNIIYYLHYKLLTGVRGNISELFTELTDKNPENINSHKIMQEFYGNIAMKLYAKNSETLQSEKDLSDIKSLITKNFNSLITEYPEKAFKTKKYAEDDFNDFISDAANKDDLIAKLMSIDEKSQQNKALFSDEELKILFNLFLGIDPDKETIKILTQKTESRDIILSKNNIDGIIDGMISENEKEFGNPLKNLRLLNHVFGYVLHEGQHYTGKQRGFMYNVTECLKARINKIIEENNFAFLKEYDENNIGNDYAISSKIKFFVETELFEKGTTVCIREFNKMCAEEKTKLIENEISETIFGNFNF